MRILVTAASKHGATAEIAEAVARNLRSLGHAVEVVPPQDVASLEPYEAVVLGSAVYTSHWLAPAKQFAAQHAAALRERPVWLFSSGPIGDPPKPQETPADVAAILDQTGARAHQLFAGRLDRSQLGFAARAVTRVVHAPDGDFRDWTAVADWAVGIASTLSSETAVRP